MSILPNQVCRYNLSRKDNGIVADDFGRPNGIITNAARGRIYIGDTDKTPHGDYLKHTLTLVLLSLFRASIGKKTTNFQEPQTIYVYDRIGPMVGNRRVFAMPDVLHSGPDGIQVDEAGNVWVRYRKVQAL